MAVNFYDTTKKFYGLTTQSVDNTEVIEFESGKKRYCLKNSTGKRAFSVNFVLDSISDEMSFWQWYRNSLNYRTNTFNLTDLVSHTGTTEYRMTEEPEIINSQYPRECALKLEEE